MLLVLALCFHKDQTIPSPYHKLVGLVFISESNCCFVLRRFLPVLFIEYAKSISVKTPESSRCFFFFNKLQISQKRRKSWFFCVVNLFFFKKRDAFF